MAGITIGLAIAGAVTSYVGQKKQASAQKKFAREQNEISQRLTDNSKAQEKVRQTNLRRENDRKRRENVRAFLRSRGDTIAGAANRGALGSSAVSGALAGAGAQFASNAGNITRAENLANDLFGLNDSRASIQGEASFSQSKFQQSTASNNLITSFGSALFSNAKTIGSVFKSAGGLGQGGGSTGAFSPFGDR